MKRGKILAWLKSLKFERLKNLKKPKRSHLISASLIFLLSGMLIGYQNCTKSNAGGATFQPSPDQMANIEQLSTLTNRFTDLQKLLTGMIDTETQNRLQSELALGTRIDKVATDLYQYKSDTNSAISLLQTQTGSVQAQLTQQNSLFNTSIASVQSDLNSFKVDVGNKMSLLDTSLQNSMNLQIGLLRDQLNHNKIDLINQLQSASDLSADQLQTLSTRVLQNESKILALGNAHEELKIQLATNYATKIDLANLKALYDGLSIVTNNLNLKIDITKDMIITQLGSQVDALTDKVKYIENKVDNQGKSINQITSDLHSAIQDYRSEIQNMSVNLQDKMEDGQEQMYSFIREENSELKNQFFLDMKQQSLALTIYTRKAVAAVTLRVNDLESQVTSNKALSDQDLQNLKSSVASAKSEMANAIAAEQAARQQLSDNLQQLTVRVNLMQADLTQTQKLVAQNADQLLKLTVNFNQEKQNVEDRFQSERAKTDAQFANFQKDMQAKLQNVSDQAAQLVQDLGADVQTHFKSVVTDIAVLNSRQASLENSLKSFIEQYQTNRAKTLNLEAKLSKPKQDATNAITSSMRAITDLQIKFIKILDPDEDNKDYYNDSFNKVALQCGGDVTASFPNALGLDSFQVLSMEYLRLLLLGERTGVAEVDAIFQDYSDASTANNFHRVMMLGLIRYPTGADQEACLKVMQDWARKVLLKDSDFKSRRKFLANNDDLGRSIETLYSALSDLEKPAGDIEKLLQDSLDGALPFQPAFEAVKAQTALQLIGNAQDSLFLADRTANFERVADFSQSTKENSEEMRGLISQLRSDLNAFKASTQQRLSALETTQGNMQTSLKRALDVIMSLSDRAGYTDLKAYTVWAGAPLNYTPVLVPGYNPAVSQIQHFFSGPLSLMNKTDACTGATILPNGGIQSYYQFGQWGSCWANFRNIPQASWGNEAKTLWFRVFGSANLLNIKVEPALQATSNVYEYTNHTVAEWQKLWAGYNYNKIFDFRNLAPNDPILKLTGAFSSGVFDIKAPDAFDYYIKNIRQWSGIKFTFVPIKRLTLDGQDTDVLGTPKYYIIQLFSPLIIDMKSKGVPKTLSSSESNVDFDLTASGHPQRVGWVNGNEAGFLCLLDSKGSVRDGSQLFGEATVIKSTGLKAKNGFEALAQYDLNHDGKIDSQDLVYSQIKIWFDKDQDAKVSEGELKNLSEMGVKSISLKYKEVDPKHRNNNGNELRFVSESDKKVYDVYLGMSQYSSK